MALNPYIPGELRAAEDRVQQKEQDMFTFGEKKKEAARDDIRFGQQQRRAGRQEQMEQWELEAAQRAKEMADKIGEPLKYLDYAGQVFEKAGGNIAVPFYMEAFSRMGLADKMSAAPVSAAADPRDPSRVVFLDSSGETVMGPQGVVTIPRAVTQSVQKLNRGQNLVVGSPQTGYQTVAEGQPGPSRGDMPPMSVKEWEYYNSLSEEDQARFLDMKRQNYQIKDVGGVPSRVGTQPGSTATPISTITAEAEAGKTLKQAEEEGKVAGKGEYTPKETRAKAQERLRFGLSEMSALLGKLKGMGAAPGSDQDQGKQLLNFLFGTDPGQVITRAVGTQAQQYRDEWETLRTLMTQIVRPILGVTGREMDTPKEVERIMRTFGSLTFDYKANFNNAVRALVVYADMTKPEAEAFVQENFGQAANESAMQAGPGTPALNPQNRKVINGITYEHDGKGWYPVEGAQ